MEHSYLRTQLNQIIGLNTTRAKSICFTKDDIILTAQAEGIGEFNSSLSPISKDKFKPPKTFDEQDETISVVDLTLSENNDFLAVGYSNGEIVVFNQDGEILNHFVGHRRQISCLQFNSDSSILASGSLDNDVILWDISADTGICRLVGHQNAITDLCFIPNTKWLVSSSKDTHIRVWDIELQTCIQTVTTAASEIWTLCYISLHNQLLCAGRSREFFVFNITPEDGFDSMNPIVLSLTFQIERTISHRAQSIITNKDNSLIAVASTGKTLEMWAVHDLEKIQQKIKRKIKRAKAKAKTKAENDDDDEQPEETTEPVDDNTLMAKSEFEHFINLSFEAKICATTFSKQQLIVSLANNTIQTLTPKIEKDDQGNDKTVYKVTHQTQGHQTDIRCLAMTDDQIISAGHGECRVWDIESGTCVSHIECGEAMSMILLPFNRFVVLGTKTGDLQIIDLAEASKYPEDIKAHKGIIWSMDITIDGSEIATASEDHEVRLWGIEFDENDHPTLIHKRTLKLTDEVFSVRYNHDASLIACSLLDTTVRIFHTDTLNFYLSLYGAQLPVNSVDFSTDGALICTASVDKNLRIFGTEFGDCHRSLWAHQSSVVSVRFIPLTHYAWTIGRDGNLTLWDCDRFVNVQTLRSHIAEIWALAVSKKGQYVITGGRDKGIRIWERTQDPYYISVERENEAENRMKRDAAERLDRTVTALRGSILGSTVIDTAARQSAISMDHGEMLADAIEAAETGSPLLGSLSPEEYILQQMKKINRANIDIVMSTLPFHSVVLLLNRMVQWLNQGKEVELTVRCVCSIIKFHRTQLEASTELRPVFREAQELIHNQINQMKKRCGMNLAALKLISFEMKNH